MGELGIPPIKGARWFYLVAACAMSIGCGGGSDDPAPVLLWQATASASGAPDATETQGRSQWSTRLIAAPVLHLGRPYSGEACIEGSWTQTMTATATVRFDLSTAGPPVQPGGVPLQITRTAAAGETLTIPFRVCGPVNSTGGLFAVEALPSIRSVGGSTFALGAYSVTARWSVVGNYAP